MSETLLTTTPKKGRLTRLTVDYKTESMVGEFHVNHFAPGVVQVIARRKGGRNRWVLCSLDVVLNFEEGEGWA